MYIYIYAYTYIKVHTVMSKDKENPQCMLENAWEATRLRRLLRAACAGNARAAVALQV